MTDDPKRSRRGDYAAARIGAAIALTSVLVFLLVWDAISEPIFGVRYEASPVALAMLATTILTLLGLEAGSFIRGDGSK